MKRLLAALSFFTRIPFWKISHPERVHYQKLVTLWPLAGWLTGGVMFVLFCLCSYFMPISLAVVFAIVARVVLTGAMHEDGFADFCDGFGGGTDRASVLKIMKDSYIGSYGVVGLVLYFILLYICINTYMMIMQVQPTLHCLPYEFERDVSVWRIAAIFIAADSFSKWASSNIINILPYARCESEAKNKLVYNPMLWSERIMCFIFGVIPTLVLMPFVFVIPMFVSTFVAMGMIYLFYKKINGYTGDCCGACFIATELSYYITALVLVFN